jgi:hypothetical protein
LFSDRYDAFQHRLAYLKFKAGLGLSLSGILRLLHLNLFDRRLLTEFIEWFKKDTIKSEEANANIDKCVDHQIEDRNPSFFLIPIIYRNERSFCRDNADRLAISVF